MDSEQVVSRRRRTQLEIQQLVAEFLSSGMAQDEFCSRRGISRSALYRYLKKNKHLEKSAIATQLVPVELVDMGRRSMNRGTGLAVLLATGRKIEVGEGFDASTLERLLSVLERA
jgi:predicted transcriptional regulator